VLSPIFPLPQAGDYGASPLFLEANLGVPQFQVLINRAGEEQHGLASEREFFHCAASMMARRCLGQMWTAYRRKLDRSTGRSRRYFQAGAVPLRTLHGPHAVTRLPADRSPCLARG